MELWTVKWCRAGLSPKLTKLDDWFKGAWNKKSLITGKGLFTCNGVLALLEIDQWKREGRNRREQSKFRNQTIRQTLRLYIVLLQGNAMPRRTDLPRTLTIGVSGTPHTSPHLRKGLFNHTIIVSPFES
ncbi:uncharacterized protein CLUP02_13993 [Colletotrichum lupini]|uniref:Uncharacterized protein n=1 Tax=Colletotrichum lupini TaxID=145971 RepID=A0A9Q8T365_9PEZI|nr:uncharacterized protein CLUP02_13993 [Colletotrichum lupini]UQC88469.1 hypothetical protein CLUP02_13993 [Colletotrichum lupini]